MNWFLILTAAVSCIWPICGLSGERIGRVDDELDTDIIQSLSTTHPSSAGSVLPHMDATDEYTGNDNSNRGGGKQRREKRKTVTVDTSLGVVMGFEERYTNTFLGVPYAEPPLGTYRYRPPRPKEAWAPSVVKAFDFSNECLQSSLYSGSKRPNSEDCLYLNIWTPKHARYNARSSKDSAELLPVMIWIYGGAFLHGGAGKPEYIGTQLARRGVIVVSCNYRLGALGFLVSTVDGLYGNYGLADQKMAMIWVNQNIRSFGGDPSRVTVFGESAGAMSLGLHIFDQYQRQQRQKRMRETQTSLFQAAILQSNPLGYRFRSVAVANFLGTEFKERLDCEDLRCLQSESADELIHVQDTLMAVPRNIGDFFTWGPVITDEHFWREFRLRPGPWANMTVRQPLGVITQLAAQMASLSSPPAWRGIETYRFSNSRGRLSGEAEVDGHGESEIRVAMQEGEFMDGDSVTGAGERNTDDEDDDLSNYMIEQAEYGSTSSSDQTESRRRGKVATPQQQHQERLPSPMIPMVIGTTKDEGSVFVFTAYPTEMPKFIYQAVVFGFFRFAAPKVLKQYAVLSREQQLSPQPDYRLVLSVIIGDYLFKCPTQLFATLANSANTSVYLYEFALPTRTPGYPYCDGLACHTSELPYVFNHLDIIDAGYSYHEEDYYDKSQDEYVFMEESLDGGGDASSVKTILDEASTSKETKKKDNTATTKKATSSFFQMASNFFGQGKNEDPEKDEENVTSRRDFPPPRNMIDANVSDMMANYWINFAASHNPNEGLSASKDYHLNTRHPENVPLWVTLSGLRPRRQLHSYVSGDEEVLTTNRSRGETTEDKTSSASDESNSSDEYYRMHSKYAAELRRRMRSKSGSVRKIFNHHLIFDVLSEVQVIGDDCNCNFWNKFNYRF